MKNGDRFTGEIKGLSGATLLVSLNYVDGNIAVQWSEVAHLESSRLFVVKTESGVVYTGKIATTGVSNDPPIKIEIVEPAAKEVEVPQRKIIKLNQISESFWHRFDGAVNTGLLYSKGNESTQFNLSSQVVYTRERWYSQVDFNSSFASNSGSNVTTRNQADLEGTRLLRWNHWFFSGTTSFLQSSVQQINLQTTVAAGVATLPKEHKSRKHICIWRIRLAKRQLRFEYRRSGKPEHGSRSRRHANQSIQIQKDKFGCVGLSHTGDHRPRTVSISMRMRSTTSSSSTISRGTFRSTEAGILALRQHSRKAITVPVQDSVGPLATDSVYLVLVFSGRCFHTKWKVR